MIPWRRAALVVIAALVITGLMASYDLPGEETVRSSPAPRPGEGVTAGEAARRLDGLALLDRRPTGIPRYVRSDFGTAWADVDGNGCNQRDDVLVRDARPGTAQVQRQGTCPHDVVAGTWIDPYSGRVLVFDDLKDPDQARALQIDHVVPLAEAWRSGAHSWSSDRRESFANDLASLVAADGPTNAAKGSDDPAAWRPPTPHQCDYAIAWIDVKHRWTLGADPSEIRALRDLLETC